MAEGEAGVGGEEKLIAVGAAVDAGVVWLGSDGEFLKAAEEGGHS